jgi:cobalt-precorrin 5A hydrolase
MGGGEAMTRNTLGRVIAGVGCRAGCPAEDIVALVQEACARTGRPASALAAPAFKQGERGVRDAARLLALPLLLVDDAALAAAQPRCPTRSDVAARAVGAASVAEGSALAAAGAGGRLLLPRIGGARATCALAEEPAL